MHRMLLVCLIITGLSAAPVDPSELKQQTVVAFDRYIRVTEARMKDDVQSDRFLAIDRLPDVRRQKVYDSLQHGEIYIDQLRTLEDGQPIHVPSGLIHDWVGVIFIPGATLPETLAVLRDYDHHSDIYKPDIRRSRVVQESGNELKVQIQFYKKTIVTVAINVDFDVEFTQFGSARSQSVSHSTRVAEVANLGKPNEHEYPVGRDHGYMWRLNSYWRIEEKDGGVYLQNESIALSRTVPFVFAWLVNPLLKSIPRSALSCLLLGTRNAVLKAKNSSPASQSNSEAVP